LTDRASHVTRSESTVADLTGRACALEEHSVMQKHYHTTPHGRTLADCTERVIDITFLARVLSILINILRDVRAPAGTCLNWVLVEMWTTLDLHRSLSLRHHIMVIACSAQDIKGGLTHKKKTSKGTLPSYPTPATTLTPAPCSSSLSPRSSWPAALSPPPPWVSSSRFTSTPAPAGATARRGSLSLSSS
jgi:hypothetical protein